MSKPIVNVDDIELQPPPPGMEPTGPAAERYGARMGFIGPRVGAQKLGYNITALPPGKRAFPLHCHSVNEEMFFVLEGTGEVTIGQATWPIRKGDIIACPPGGPETAHQITNTGTGELRYLAVSTKQVPEVVEYPVTGKFGLLAQLPGPDGQPRPFRYVGRPDLAADYWDGE